MSNNRVKSFVERAERLIGEREAIGADLRDVFAEAKGVGYDVKTLKWLIQERKMDAADRDERDTLRDTYAHAMDMAIDLVRVDGLSQREAARAAGVSKSSLNRALAVPAASQEPVPHNPETGEIDEINPEQGRPEQQSSPEQAAPIEATAERDAPNVPRDDGARVDNDTQGPVVAAFDADRDMPASLRRIPSTVSA